MSTSTNGNGHVSPAEQKGRVVGMWIGYSIAAYLFSTAVFTIGRLAWQTSTWILEKL